MISTEAALIYTMVIVSAADSEMTDSEMSAIGEIVRHLPVFEEYDSNLLPDTARSCAEVLNTENGMETVLELIKRSIPHSLRKTAYALAIEVAAADGTASQEELRLLRNDKAPAGYRSTHCRRRGTRRPSAVRVVVVPKGVDLSSYRLDPASGAFAA